MAETKTLRHASLDDVPKLMEMGRTLYTDSSYSLFGLDPARAQQMLEKFIIEGQEQFLVLISHDEGRSVGALAAYAFSPLFSSDKVATEVLLWLDPEYRTGHRGNELLDAYEYWAKLVGCRAAQYGLLSSADPRLARLYERRGAKETERVYLKEL